MARIAACDLCHAHTEELSRRGSIHVGEYCADCVKVVDLYLEQVNALHEYVAHYWAEKLEDIRASFKLSEWPC